MLMIWVVCLSCDAKTPTFFLERFKNYRSARNMNILIVLLMCRKRFKDKYLPATRRHIKKTKTHKTYQNTYEHLGLKNKFVGQACCTRVQAWCVSCCATRQRRRLSAVFFVVELGSHCQPKPKAGSENCWSDEMCFKRVGSDVSGCV